MTEMRERAAHWYRRSAEYRARAERSPMAYAAAVWIDVARECERRARRFEAEAARIRTPRMEPVPANEHEGSARSETAGEPLLNLSR